MNCFHICKIAQARLLEVTLAILVIVQSMASAQTLQKPLEGDSLSYAMYMCSGIGWETFDVEQLNTSLKNSKLNAVAENAIFAGFDTKVQVGKGFLFGMGFNYCPEVYSSTTDTSGSFRTSLSSYGASINLGYSLVQQSSLLVFPSIGFGFGSNATEIKFTSKNSRFPFLPATIREGLLTTNPTVVENTTINIKLTLGIEAYVKLFSIGVQENQIQDKPNTPVKVQSRGEIWIGGFASYNPNIMSASSNNSSGENLGFTPSGFQYGIRLMAATALRYIVP